MGWENTACFFLQCITMPLSGLKGDQLWPFAKGIDQVDIVAIQWVIPKSLYQNGLCLYCTHSDGWGKLFRSGSEVKGDSSSIEIPELHFWDAGFSPQAWGLAYPLDSELSWLLWWSCDITLVWMLCFTSHVACFRVCFCTAVLVIAISHYCTVTCHF